MNGAQLLKKALKDADIKYLFGYTGGAIMPFYNEIFEDRELVHIMARNEQGAGFMAQGLSRASMATQKPQMGVCISTSGPGATNLVTAIADAYMDSINILAITGQVATNVIATDAFQETDMVGLMMPITKQTYMPLKPEDVEQMTHEALFVANNARPGPVHIDLPKDIQTKEVGKNYRFDFKSFVPALPARQIQNDNIDSKIATAVEMINQAKSPLIFSGHGIVISGSGKKLIELATKHNIPIASTMHGLSAFACDHPLHLGMMGMHGTISANKAIQNADLVIAFGMRFDDRVTGRLDSYARNTKIIHIDIDQSEIDKNVKVELGLNMDAKSVIEQLLTHPKLIKKARRKWLEQIRTYKDDHALSKNKMLETGNNADSKLLMKSIISQLSDITDGKDIIVSDVGQNEMFAANYYNFQTENSWFASGGAGTMGAGLPMSIGVKLARPNQTVWLITGDGGFQMNMQELGTILQYGFEIKILILNNSKLGMVRQWQTLFYNKRYAETNLTNPNFGQIAKAYQIGYQKVSEYNQIKKGHK
jgi:acetolactate synthase I/II/III large subunit